MNEGVLLACSRAETRKSPCFGALQTSGPERVPLLRTSTHPREWACVAQRTRAKELSEKVPCEGLLEIPKRLNWKSLKPKQVVNW
jgi:hypothetical protein